MPSEIFTLRNEVSKSFLGIILMQKLYALSKKLRELKPVGQEVLGMHLYRLSYFVDQSDKGFECTYAKQTVKHVEGGRGELLAQLEHWREILEEVIEGLKVEE